MSTPFVCDRSGCTVTTERPRRVLGEYQTPPGWVRVETAESRRIYCSPRCAVLVLGGRWIFPSEDEEG